MQLGALCFAFGAVVLHAWPGVPPAAISVMWVPALWGVRYPGVRRYTALFVLGVAWAAGCAHARLADRLDIAVADTALFLEGRVVSLPHRDGRREKWLAQVTALRAGERELPYPHRVALSRFYQAAATSTATGRPAVRMGYLCGFWVRLKPPRGLRNPVGFDFERYAYANNIGAVGYVIPHPANNCHASRRWFDVAAWRQRLADRIRVTLGGSSHGAVVTALAVGHRDALHDDQWALLRATGTAHLVAISGLHISLVAAGTFWLARRFMAPCAQCLPVPTCAALCAGLAAVLYAALAGFTLPTQRALIMVLCALGGVICGRRVFSFDTLALALAGVILIQPAAVVTIGFWLSFVAVAVLLSMHHYRSLGRGWRALRVHLTLTVGLLPILVTLEQAVPWSAPLANLIAVPVTGVIVVPLTLLGVMFDPWIAPVAEYCWRGAAAVWRCLWWVLEQLHHIVGTLRLSTHPDPATLILSAAAVMVLLVPWWRGRFRFGLVLLTAPLMVQPERPHQGQFNLTVLDVGQGLACVVETRHHVLVFDTGPSFGRHASAAANIIVPLLRARGWARIDRLVISHGDHDHAGGVAELRAALPVIDILASAGEAMPPTASLCRAGQTWHWDGVTFAVIHPSAGYRGSENDRSCVLKIKANAGAALLTGDIENAAERDIVARNVDVQAGLLVVPHHGSDSSSSPAFVARVAPQIAIIPAGYRNRFKFPAAAVRSRYLDQGTQIYVTGVAGAVEARFTTEIEVTRAARLAGRRLWLMP